MEKKKFNKLVKSIKQAEKIKRGEPLEDDSPYKPVAHDHEAFLKKALKRKEFRKSCEDLGGDPPTANCSRIIGVLPVSVLGSTIR